MGAHAAAARAQMAGPHSLCLWRCSAETESWVEGSPLVEVELRVTWAGSGRLL